ncbi:S49 family peptidase [Sinorhizobium meliloti]|nr:S49 family peptidase [Sinorhizobium meliloti]MDX0026927.1 S49 family peptidase [Sinorhizobium meliloti]MDX0070417.1 S49 family peptidase [Sinorhizobium meliloti]RVH66518.1 S49 family peptidase [Sinorhizobium meliloti]RVK64559.1 S49 family peptidase [Sinorhizobium meliloti]
MKFEHVLTAFMAEPWAIQREKLAVLADVLVARAEGEKLFSTEFAAAVSDARAKEIAEIDGNVAVIPVYGVLANKMDAFSAMSGGTSYAGIRRSLHSALSNEDVKAVILDVDSPGGSVPGTEELATEIRRIRGGDKPIVAQVNSLAASAAYWIASAADEIVVTPSGRAGSIGVYTAHDDVSAALEKRGIKRTYISAGKFKVEGNETEPLGKETLEHIQDGVNRSYDRFVSAVAEGRGTTVGKVEDGFGQGRVFYAEALMDRGMVDRVATMEETLERFGAETQPAYVRRVKAQNQARAESAEVLVAKMRSGESVTIREFENGIRGLMGLTGSEAERAARLYLKKDQGEPDVDADAAALAAVERLLTEARSFKITR